MPSQHDVDLCTLATCPVKWSIFKYRPSVVANAVLLSLFAISLIAHVGQGFFWRHRAFGIVMFFGCLTEIIGYAGRLISWHNPFSQTGFLTQICCLTLAPAFFAAAIYTSIYLITKRLGAGISRISPRTYLLIFVPCDIVSLSLQGAGGGVSSVRSQANEDPKLGSNIAIAGLVFQVVTLTLFIVLSAEFAWRYWQARQRSGPIPEHQPLLNDKSFRLFLFALVLATVCIFIRCIYRVVELAGGWDGALIHDQTKFVVLEGVMVIIASVVLNVGHPGPGLKPPVLGVDEKGNAETPSMLQG